MSILSFPERQPSEQERALSASDLLTPDEAAQLLRVGRTTVYKLMKSGELPSITISRRRFITQAGLAKYRAARERHSLPPSREL